MSINPGLIFLERAHALLLLVEAGEIAIQDAIMGLAPAFWELAHPMHPEDVITYERMERDYPPVAAKRTKQREAA